jgi:YtkA-like
MVRWTVPTAIAAAALAAPATALGGGFSTVGLDSLPDGTAAGRAWVVELTVMAHGRTPVDGAAPRVVVAEAGGGAERSFRAIETRRRGVYVARVVFPSPGLWRYAVHESYGARHSFAPVRIGDGGGRALRAVRTTPAPSPSPPSAGEPEPAAGLGAAGLAGPLAALLALAAQRRRGGPDGGARRR